MSSADVAQLVERHASNVDVAGSSPVFRSCPNLIVESVKIQIKYGVRLREKKLHALQTSIISILVDKCGCSLIWLKPLPRKQRVVRSSRTGRSKTWLDN